MNTTQRPPQQGGSISQRAVQASAHGRQEVAVLEAPRLPFHPAIEERFGVKSAAWKVLVEAVFPTAKSTNSVILALAYCRERNLDPMKRVVHIVPMWQKRRKVGNQWVEGHWVETIWPSIAELRTTAFRTGQYAGKDAIELGPEEEREFHGVVEAWAGGEKREEKKTVKVKFPIWGRITLHRTLKDGKNSIFVGPKVYWLEEYGRLKATDLPNDMWAKRPHGQFEKVVEAAALRCVFPEEIGNDYTSEEMEGKTIDAIPENATLTVETRQPAAVITDQYVEYTNAEELPADERHAMTEDIPEELPPDENIPAGQQLTKEQWLEAIDKDCAAIFSDTSKSWEAMMQYQNDKVIPMKNNWDAETHKKGMDIVSRWAQDAIKRQSTTQ
jgi:phage recombination protein Bet